MKKKHTHTHNAERRDVPLDSEYTYQWNDSWWSLFVKGSLFSLWFSIQLLKIHFHCITKTMKNAKELILIRSCIVYFAYGVYLVLNFAIQLNSSNRQMEWQRKPNMWHNRMLRLFSISSFQQQTRWKFTIFFVFVFFFIHFGIFLSPPFHLISNIRGYCLVRLLCSNNATAFGVQCTCMYISYTVQCLC